MSGAGLGRNVAERHDRVQVRVHVDVNGRVFDHEGNVDPPLQGHVVDIGDQVAARVLALGIGGQDLHRGQVGGGVFRGIGGHCKVHFVGRGVHEDDGIGGGADLQQRAGV